MVQKEAVAPATVREKVLIFLPITGPYLLQYQSIRKYMPTGAVVAQLLWTTHCFLGSNEVCSPGGNCIPVTPGQKSMAEKVTGPRIEPDIVIAMVSFSCGIDTKLGRGNLT